ncbi:zinc finger BED domain-containing protein 4-like [Sinocyclocheilus rhinocerous]|uniref:zinc finger BED domain-containing protein 4-like n=1 Tax=Sinocyclocheilus rhinocerous TaxID=307959 RepID=UPI0007BA7ED4|nr:PREDICTED: zinc finger BED domain-containing protein 4-like [Sinocyclocheilus rhinocerous]
MTRQVSSSDALASDVIPAVTVLQRLLLKQMNEDHGIKTMKSTLLDALQRRFSNMEQNPLYCIASLLDPRYKDQFFSNTDTASQAKEMLILELQKMSVGETATPETHMAHQLTKGLTATSQVAVWTVFLKKLQMDVHLHLRAELQQPSPYSWKHTLERPLCVVQRNPSCTGQLIICDFLLWLKWHKNIFQPHAAVWKVKDSSAQCHTF